MCRPMSLAPNWSVARAVKEAPRSGVEPRLPRPTLLTHHACMLVHMEFEPLYRNFILENFDAIMIRAPLIEPVYKPARGIGLEQ